MKFFKNLRTKKCSKDEIKVVIKSDSNLSDEQKQIITTVVKQGTERNLYPSEIAINISMKSGIFSAVSLQRDGNVITVFI